MGVGASSSSRMNGIEDMNNLNECLRENIRTLQNVATTSYSDQGDHEDTDRILFHQVRGRNVVLSSDHRVASRLETSFCDGIVFSNRAVFLGERVYIRVLKTSDLWTSMIRFGFTNVNPDMLKKNNTSSGIRNGSLEYDEEEDSYYPFSLPKYVYPDLTNREGYWAGALGDHSLKENDIVFFYYNQSGEIHYGINNSHKGKFLDGLKFNQTPLSTGNPCPFWAIIDIYGNTISIEFISESESRQFVSMEHSQSSLLSNSSSTNSSMSSSLSSTTTLPTIIPNRNYLGGQEVQMRQKKQVQEFDKRLISFRRLCIDNHLNETLSNSLLIENSPTESSPISSNQVRIQAFYEKIPILLHEPMNETVESQIRFMNRLKGRNVNINETSDSTVVYRESDTFGLSRSEANIRGNIFQNTYAFLDKPIEAGSYFCLQIAGIDQNLKGAEISLGLGCTSCHPGTLDPRIDLPDDPDELLDRSEYWVVYKNIFTKKSSSSSSSSSHYQVSLADELCFRLDETTGDVHFYINSCLATKCLFSVDVTQRLWFFFYLNGKINAIRLIPACHSASSSNGNERAKSRPQSALIELINSQLAVHDGNKTAVLDSNNNIGGKNNQSSVYSQEECKICLNAPIECVLYSCGHMCLCWNCATQLKTKKTETDQANTSFRRRLLSKKNNSQKPLCPICREEIIDIIRVFKS